MVKELQADPRKMLTVKEGKNARENERLPYLIYIKINTNKTFVFLTNQTSGSGNVIIENQ